MTTDPLMPGRDLAHLAPTSPDLAPGEVAEPIRTTSPTPPPPYGAGRGRGARIGDLPKINSGDERGRGELPTWLARHLEDIGVLNPDGATRAARASQCTRCRALTLRGLDADICALTAVVDTDPTTAAGEVIALAAGRWTYFLLPESNSSGKRIWTINRREVERITANRPDRIMVEHRCEQPLPKAPQPVEQATPSVSDEPPF